MSNEQLFDQQVECDCQSCDRSATATMHLRKLESGELCDRHSYLELPDNWGRVKIENKRITLCPTCVIDRKLEFVAEIMANDHFAENDDDGQ